MVRSKAVRWVALVACVVALGCSSTESSVFTEVKGSEEVRAVPCGECAGAGERSEGGSASVAPCRECVGSGYVVYRAGQR